MKALMNPHRMEGMPNVAAWLRHSHAAEHVVRSGYAGLDDAGLVRAASLENIVVQLAHLRTHPSVAAGIARGEISLPGRSEERRVGNECVSTCRYRGVRTL